MRRNAILFNDRYGMERIYFHESKEAFYFAAEAKAILGVRPELRKWISRPGAICRLREHPEDRTLFPGLQVLPRTAQVGLSRTAAQSEGMIFRNKGMGGPGPLWT